MKGGSPTRVAALPFGELTQDLEQRWGHFQSTNERLLSPYFHPTFFRALHDVGRRFEVALEWGADDVVAFLPFERRRFDLARPAGWPMCDYQGVVSDAAHAPRLDAIVTELRLRALDFDHLLPDQAAAAGGSWIYEESPVIELAGGYEAYAKSRSESSDVIREAERKLRKVEREIGPVTLVWDTLDAAILQQLIALKSAQYHRTTVLDLFATPWPGAFLLRLLSEKEPDFGSVLTAMYFGDHLAAIHLGLRSRGTLHYWFPAYDPALQKYSPGTILILQLLRAASEHGVERIDLGKGTERYKERFASSRMPLAKGSIVRSVPLRVLRRGWNATRRWIRSSRLRPALEPLIGSARRLRESLAIR